MRPEESKKDYSWLENKFRLFFPPLISLGIAIYLAYPLTPLFDEHFLAAVWILLSFFLALTSCLMQTLCYIRHLLGKCPVYYSTLTVSIDFQRAQVKSRFWAALSFPADIGRLALFSSFPILGWYYLRYLLRGTLSNWPWQDKAVLNKFFGLIMAICVGIIYPLSMLTQPMEIAWETVNDQAKYGFKSRFDSWIIPPGFDEIRPFAQNALLTVFRKGEKWGYLNMNGTIAMEPVFTSIGWWDEANWDEQSWNLWQNFFLKWEKLLPFKQNEKWGFIHTNGLWAIPPDFDEVRPFSGEREDKKKLAAFRRGKLWGFIDVTGKEIAPPTFVMAFSLFNSTDYARNAPIPPAVVFNQSRWTYFSPPASFTTIANDMFSPLLPAANGQAIGYIDITGNFALPPNYGRAENFKHDFALVDLWKTRLEESPNIVTEVKIEAIIDLSGKMLAWKQKWQGKWKHEILEAEDSGNYLESIKSSHCKDYFVFPLNGKNGVLDSKKGIVIPPIYDLPELKDIIEQIK